jgi:hypothetical protein
MRVNLNTLIVVMLLVGVALFASVSFYRHDQLTQHTASTQAAQRRAFIEISEVFFQPTATPAEIANAWRFMVQFPDGVPYLTQKLPLRFVIYNQNTLFFSGKDRRNSPYELQRKISGPAPYLYVVRPSIAAVATLSTEWSDLSRYFESATPVESSQSTEAKTTEEKIENVDVIGPFDESFSISTLEIHEGFLGCVFKQVNTGKEIPIHVALPKFETETESKGEDFVAELFAAMETELVKHSEYHSLVKIADRIKPTVTPLPATLPP